MATETYISREFPFMRKYSKALGEDLNITFPLKKTSDGSNLTGVTPTNFSFVIKKAPIDHREFADLPAVVSVTQGGGKITFALPNATVVVNVTATTKDWENQETGLYWCKFAGDIDGRRRTPSEFLLEVTA